MTWFAKGYIAENSLSYKKKMAEELCCCEHVEVDPACAAYIHKEMESSSPVSCWVYCEACSSADEERRKRDQAEREAEMARCDN